MQKITPFLWFDGNAEEAINFYVSIFKNSKIVSIKRYPTAPMTEPMKGMEGKILTAVFELEGQRFMAIDGGPYFKPSGVISLYVDCQSQDDVDHYWSKLSEGSDPKTHQCGWVQDKFGFYWQIIPAMLIKLLNDSDKSRADRAMKAMLKMKKIDVATLQRAVNEN